MNLILIFFLFDDKYGRVFTVYLFSVCVRPSGQESHQVCACQQKLERFLNELEEAQIHCEALTRQLESHKLHSRETVTGKKKALIARVKVINWRVQSGAFSAGGPAVCPGEGLGLEGGLLAGAGSGAAEHRLLSGEGAGAGARAAQQGGRETSEPSRLVLRHPIKTIYSSAWLRQIFTNTAIRHPETGTGREG